MRPLSTRQMAILIAVVTVISTALTYFASHGDWYSTLLTVPFVALASFWSFRLSQRLARRYTPPEARRSPVTMEPSSERPEHAQRRRQRRRPRGAHRPE